MAYFLINKATEKTLIIIDNTALADLLGVHRHTITNWFKPNSEGIAAKQKETDKYTVIKADEYIKPNTSKGNRDEISIKKAKAEGEIKSIYPKKKRRWRKR